MLGFDFEAGMISGICVGLREKEVTGVAQGFFVIEEFLLHTALVICMAVKLYKFIKTL